MDLSFMVREKGHDFLQVLPIDFIQCGERIGIDIQDTETGILFYKRYDNLRLCLRGAGDMIAEGRDISDQLGLSFPVGFPADSFVKGNPLTGITSDIGT